MIYVSPKSVVHRMNFCRLARFEIFAAQRTLPGPRPKVVLRTFFTFTIYKLGLTAKTLKENVVEN